MRRAKQMKESVTSAKESVVRTTDVAERAVKLQAVWRGNLVRHGGQIKSAAKTGAAAMASPLGRLTTADPFALTEATPEEKETTLRAKMAAGLYPTADTEAQLRLLADLEASLVNIGEAKPPTGTAAAPTAAEVDAEAPTAEASAEAGAAEVSTTMHESERSGLRNSAKCIQAKFRGRSARRRAELDGGKEEPSQSSDAEPGRRASIVSTIFLRPRLVAASLVPLAAAGAYVISLVAATWPRLWYVTGVLLSFTLSASFYVGLSGCALYLWLRLPFYLGWLASELITRLAVYNYPMRMKSIRLRPWLQLRPLTLHLDLHVTSFTMANPPGCAADHFVSADNVHRRTPTLAAPVSTQPSPRGYRLAQVEATASVDLSGLHIGRPGVRIAGPLRICFSTLNISGVFLSFMMASTGEFNIKGLVRALATGEVRQALGGIGIHPYRSLTLPNVLKITIHAVRGLRRRPKLKPMVQVKMRQHVISTAVGRPSDDGSTFTFDATLLMPLTDPSTVLHVCVYNTHVAVKGNAPALLGQWVMTTKHLYVAPAHCKHSALRVHKDRAVAGTFLLSDAKLRGSAVRGLGHREMGGGYSGEVDMTIAWVHSAVHEATQSRPPPPPATPQPSACGSATANPVAPKKAAPRPPIVQLNEGSAEDALRLGNLGEVRAFLTSLPIRLDIERMTLRKVSVEMTDIFAGNSAHQVASSASERSSQGADGEAGDGKGSKDAKEAGVVYVKELAFAPFVDADLYTFLETFFRQCAARVLWDRTAIISAATEIFGGVVQNMSSSLRSTFRSSAASALSSSSGARSG